MARPTRPIRSITLGLAWRLFLAQAFTVLFAVVALILTWGDKDTWGMDMFMAEAVAKAVHSEGGRLVLDQVCRGEIYQGGGRDIYPGLSLPIADYDERQGGWVAPAVIHARRRRLLRRRNI